MVRPGDHAILQEIGIQLTQFQDKVHHLPGIQSAARRQTLLAQLVESTRRVKYVSAIKDRDVALRRADPRDELFDPLKAAILFQREGRFDEAFWMVFLFVHFGKHSRGRWRYIRDVYGRLGDPDYRWDWAATIADPRAFCEWLHAHQQQIKGSRRPGGFGSHRKYQTLDAYSSRGTGQAVVTYIQWVGPPRTHQELMNQALDAAERNPRAAFGALYRSMDRVASFGRTARFDYLAMIGKLDLATIEPDSPYIQDSTGPLSGARLLFGHQHGPRLLNQWLIELESQMGVGMQVMEDALCNWQKNPDMFVPFRG